MNELTYDIGRYLAQAAPHVRKREGAVLLGLAQDELLALKAQVNELRKLARDVTWFDFRDNDNNFVVAVDAIDALRVFVESKTPEASLSTHNKKIRDECIAELRHDIQLMEIFDESDEYGDGFLGCQKAVLNMLEPWPDKGDK